MCIDKTIDLAIKAHDGDINAFNKIYEEYSKFITFEASRVVDSKALTMDKTEAISIRSESFVKTIKKMDKEILEKMERKTLTSFISKQITWDIIAESSKQTKSLLHFPKDMVVKSWRLKRFKEKFEKDNKPLPDKEVIKKELKVSDKELEVMELIIDRNREYESTEAIFLVKDKKDAYKDLENKIFILQIMDCLKERERIVIEGLFFKELSNKEVGRKIGRMEEAVRKTKIRALEKMKAEILRGA